MQLGDIAEIKPGFTFREAIEPNIKGSVFVVQAKIVLFGQEYIQQNDLTKTSFQPPRTATYLQKSDIILVARGIGAGAFRSAVFDLNVKNVIPSSSVFIVRIINNKVIPEFLSLFINSSEGQRLVLKTVSGSNVHTISRRELEKIDIRIPSITVQQGIIALARNIRQQEKITERKNQLKRNIINATITNLTHNK